MYICMHVMRILLARVVNAPEGQFIIYFQADWISRWTDLDAARTKDSNNPIALMQFADHETVLLIRTHRTEA